jgi:hypothetical protein
VKQLIWDETAEIDDQPARLSFSSAVEVAAIKEADKSRL